MTDLSAVPEDPLRCARCSAPLDSWELASGGKGHCLEAGDPGYNQQLLLNSNSWPASSRGLRSRPVGLSAASRAGRVVALQERAGQLSPGAHRVRATAGGSGLPRTWGSRSGCKAHRVTPLALSQMPSTRAEPHPLRRAAPPPGVAPPPPPRPASWAAPASGPPLAGGSSLRAHLVHRGCGVPGTRGAPEASRGLEKSRGPRGEHGKGGEEKWGSSRGPPQSVPPARGPGQPLGPSPALRDCGRGRCLLKGAGRRRRFSAGERIRVAPGARSAVEPCPCHGRAARGAGGAPGPPLGKARALEGAPGEADPGGGQSSG